MNLLCHYNCSFQFLGPKNAFTAYVYCLIALNALIPLYESIKKLLVSNFYLKLHYIANFFSILTKSILKNEISNFFGFVIPPLIIYKLQFKI